MQDIYQKITDQIIAKLEQGTVPWRKPWSGGVTQWPTNLLTGRRYTGINLMILGVLSSEYDSPYWLTFRQAKQLGGHVRKGEKSTEIVFWGRREYTKEDKETGEEKKYSAPFLRSYRVFNVSQCAGLKRTAPKGVEIAPTVDNDFDPIESCEAVVMGYVDAPPIASDGGNRAYYRPATDSIHMPKRENFDSEPEYYSTLFHEIIHSTGHKSRLSRSGITGMISFGSDSYSEEELVAEFGSGFLCGVAGIENDTIDNSAAYINGWLSKLRSDKKLAVIAASRASKAADHILGNEVSR